MRAILYWVIGLSITLTAGCGDSGGGSGGSAGAGGSGGGGGSAGVGGAAGGGGSAGVGGSGGSGGAAGAAGSSGNGIAAQYPGNQGIGSDPRVIFADDFESYSNASELNQRWEAVYNRTGLTRDPANVFAGNQALEFTAPQQSNELSNGVAKVLTNELDQLYLRYYSKYDPSFDIVGSSHNGGGISAHYFVNGNATPGIPANGTNKFLIEFENWRGEAATMTPGEQNIYIYHPEQRTNYGDHFFPDGRVMPNTSIPNNFGSEFVWRPNFTPQLGRWYSFEVMLKANTPGQRDGRIKCWIDGQLVAEFPNLRLRDIDTLKIDRFGLSLHFGSNPSGVTHKWYDNVVAATEYIGPMAP